MKINVFQAKTKNFHSFCPFPKPHNYKNLLLPNKYESCSSMSSSNIWFFPQFLRYNIFLIWCIYFISYRVFHETWQLVISFKSRLPKTVLDIKSCLQFITYKTIFAQVFFFEVNFYIIWLLYNIFIVLGIKRLNKLWKKKF